MASPVSAVQNIAQAASNSSTGSNSDSPTTTAPNQQISEATFLQLLVAQLQNQDPLQPMDGMQFVTQLAQFSQLESIYDIQSDTDKLAGATPATSTSSTSGTTPTTGS
jgi:flagellar basal-body rod modification protein FlgD